MNIILQPTITFIAEKPLKTSHTCCSTVSKRDRVVNWSSQHQRLRNYWKINKSRKSRCQIKGQIRPAVLIFSPFYPAFVLLKVRLKRSSSRFCCFRFVWSVWFGIHPDTLAQRWTACVLMKTASGSNTNANESVRLELQRAQDDCSCFIRL